MNNILVIGSPNTDMIIKTDILPCPGEKIVGGTLMVNSDEKGTYQVNPVFISVHYLRSREISKIFWKNHLNWVVHSL